MRQVLDRYGMGDCNPTKLPLAHGTQFSLSDEPSFPPTPEAITDFRGKIGSVIYAMKQIRLDIAYTVGVLAKHMSNPGPNHIKALHHLFRYLKGTQNHGLTFVGKKRLEIKGFCDASYNSSPLTTESVTGWVTTVGGTALS